MSNVDGSASPINGLAEGSASVSHAEHQQAESSHNQAELSAQA
jgi:hypothetical protein